MHELALAGAPLVAGTWLGIKWWFAAKARRRRAPPSPLAFEHAPGADGRLYSMSSFQDAKLLVVVFMSNRCPGVKAYDGRLRALSEEFGPHGVQFVGVNPIDEALYPTESLREMATALRERNLPFPYLKDASQGMARRFGAICTPHTFVLDEARRIRYSGKIDDAFIPTKASRHHLRDAITDLLAGKDPMVASTMPLGCAIDWSNRTSSVSHPSSRRTPNVTHH
jgi:peroxiredoxin